MSQHGISKIAHAAFTYDTPTGADDRCGLALPGGEPGNANDNAFTVVIAPVPKRNRKKWFMTELAMVGNQRQTEWKMRGFDILLLIM